MQPEIQGLTAMQLDVVRRLEDEGRAIQGLEADLRDKIVAFDALVVDALLLGLDARHVSAEVRPLMKTRIAERAGKPRGAGRFARRRAKSGPTERDDR
jgi:hypothetical protein